MKNKVETRTIVLGAILTALVIILQFMGSFVKFGPFSISLVLIPIVIGAATGGIKVGAWLGFVFGGAVLLSGDAAPFLAVSIFGTVLTVLVKGVVAGLMAGLFYKLFEKYNTYLAVIAAAIVCPLTNTGIFLVGCLIFFMDTIKMWASAAGFSENAGEYMIFVLVGGNFLFELLSNIILSPVVVRLLNIKKKMN